MHCSWRQGSGGAGEGFQRFGGQELEPHPSSTRPPTLGGPIAMLHTCPRALTKPAAQPSTSIKVSGLGHRSGGGYHWQSLVALG